MSVVFKKVNEKSNDYQVVIAFDANDNPKETLRQTTDELIRVLKDADMDGMQHNYILLLDLLAAMMPDENTFKELKKDYYYFFGKKGFSCFLACIYLLFDK